MGEEQFGMTLDSAMQLVRMMAAELGLVEVKIPLTKGKWAYLYVPKEFKIRDAERISGFVKTLVMEEIEVEGHNHEDRLRRLEEARIRQEARYGKAIHAHPTAKTRGKTGCCGKDVNDLEEAALLTTDPKVVTCSSKPED